MKNLIVLTMLMVGFAFSAVAQNTSLKNEELEIKFVYRHADTHLERPTGISQFGLADARNSAGFGGGYTHYFGDDTRRGNFGIGMEGIVTFSGNDAATVDSGNIAVGRAQAKAVYMDNSPNKKFRLGAKLTGGIARQQFKQKAIVVGDTVVRSRGQNAWTGGGGVFADYGEGRRRLRVGMEYYYLFYTKQSEFFPERSNQHSVEASIGLVF